MLSTVSPTDYNKINTISADIQQILEKISKNKINIQSFLKKEHKIIKKIEAALRNKAKNNSQLNSFQINSYRGFCKIYDDKKIITAKCLKQLQKEISQSFIQQEILKQAPNFNIIILKLENIVDIQNIAISTLKSIINEAEGIYSLLTKSLP